MAGRMQLPLPTGYSIGQGFRCHLGEVVEGNERRTCAAAPALWTHADGTTPPSMRVAFVPRSIQICCLLL